MPNGWRTIKSFVHKIRLHGRRGKGMAESFSREKLREAPQKEDGWKILCYLLLVWPRPVRPLKSRMNGKKTHTHTHMKQQFYTRHQIQPEYGDEQADAGRDGWTRLARPNSQARTGTGEYYFPCSADHEQDWQPYPVDPYSAICNDHTYYT